MKFNDLPIGRRFQFDGAVYRKTSPVLASPERGGGSKFMARYAVVAPLDGAAPAAKPDEPRLLPSATVLAAFDDFDAALRAEHSALAGDLPADRMEALAGAQEQARERFLAAIDAAAE